MMSRMTPDQGAQLFKFTGMKFWEPEEVPPPTKQQAERGIEYCFAWKAGREAKNTDEEEKNFRLFVDWAKQWFPNYDGESLRIPIPESPGGAKAEEGVEGSPVNPVEGTPVKGQAKYRIKTIEEIQKEFGENWKEKLTGYFYALDQFFGEEISEEEYKESQEKGFIVKKDKDNPRNTWNIYKDAIKKESQSEEQEEDAPRIKTEKEMVDSLGPNWKTNLVPAWRTRDNKMDYLLGEKITQEQFDKAQKEGILSIPILPEKGLQNKEWNISKDALMIGKEKKQPEPVKKEIKYDPELDPAYSKLKKYLTSDIPFLNIFLVGPAGCGKTTFPKMIGKEFNIPVTILPCNSGTSPQEIRGFNWPKVADSPVSAAVEIPGIIVLDEFTMLDASTAAVANSLLANNQMLASTGLKDRHPKCVIIVTANTMGHGADRQYVGNNQLDAATLDRFANRKISVDYNEAYEFSVGDKEVVELVHKIRKQVKENGIRKPVSTRAIINATDDKKAGFSWWKDSLFDNFTDIEIEQIKAKL